jgi:hypothetical protein
LNVKKERYPEDKLIREALHLEFESVELPSADKMWHAIEANLNQQRAPFRIIQSSWIRYAGLAAAACLVIVLGGLGLFRAGQFATPAADLDAGVEFEAAVTEREEITETEALAEPELSFDTGDDVEVLQPESEESVSMTAEEEKAATEEQLPPAADTDPFLEFAPSWPERLGKSYLFEEEILITAVEEERYRVALYGSDEHDLLLVRSEIAEEDIMLFVEKLGEQLHFPIRNILPEDGFIYFEAGGYSGLAFMQEGFNRAILVPAGITEKEQLKNLAAPLQ